MYAKYMCSALALCLSFASALDVFVPLTVRAGTSVELDVTVMTGGPTTVGLLLCDANGTFDIDLASDATVAPTIEVHIPKHVPARPEYFIAAIEPGNVGIIYSKSNLFKIEPRRH